jgi:hypothetical protein
MVLLTVLSGKNAPASHRFQRFPIVVGRGPAHDLSVVDDGVWDRHLLLELAPDRQFKVRCRTEAFAAINGVVFQEQAPLRNGDVIELGGTKIRFSLSETRLSSQKLREICTWLFLTAMLLLQIGLIYQLGFLFR